MFGFDDFDLEDLIEADIEYGLFEDEQFLEKFHKSAAGKQIKKSQKKKSKSFWDILKG